jgi:MFS family permease
VHDWRRNQVAVTAAAFVGFTGFTLVMPFLPLYIRQLGVTDVGDIALWTGVTLGASPAIAALVGPLWGRIGDRFGNKILVQRSLVSFVVVMSAMAYVTEAWQLFALRAVQGFFAGYGALTLSMAALSAPPEKVAFAVGTVQTAHRLGPAIGPIIGGVLAPLVGLRNAFLFAAAFYAVAFVIVTVLYREPPRGPKQPRGDLRTSFGTILTFENFLLLMLVIFGFQVVDRSFGPVLSLYLDQLGYPSADVPLLAGILFSVLALSAAAGNQLAARLARRHSPRSVIATAALIAAGALSLVIISSNVWVLAAWLAVFGSCIGTSMTTAYTAANAVIPREVHSTAFGFLTSAQLIGVAASPVLAGLVGARSIRVVFVAGVVALVSLAVVVRNVMVERTQDVEPEPAVDEG